MKKTLFTALVACMAFSNCTNVKTNKFSTQPNILGQWTIVEANGMSTDSVENIPFIQFGDSGRVNGNASVNTFFGQYTLKGDSISFDQIGATMMMGREKDMQVEMAIMSALAQSATLEIQDSVMNAKDHDGNVVMTLTRN